MDRFCFLNGTIAPLSQAHLSLYDIGVLRGFGIYEGLVSHNRRPFMFADHMARFHASAKRMELKIPLSDEELERAALDLIEKNIPQGKEGLIRIILTGGAAIDGIAYNPKTPTLFMLVEEFVPIEERFVQEGASIATFEHLRQFPELKSINYIQAVLLQRVKREKQVVEVLYTHQGRALECTGSNVFIVKKGSLVTPGQGIIFGITRKAVIELAKNEFPLEERDVSIEETLAADEVFITGSFKEVVPVVSIDGKKIGNGAPGPVSKRVVELFRALTASYGLERQESAVAGLTQTAAT